MKKIFTDCLILEEPSGDPVETECVFTTLAHLWVFVVTIVHTGSLGTSGCEVNNSLCPEPDHILNARNLNELAILPILLLLPSLLLLTIIPILQILYADLPNLLHHYISSQSWLTPPILPILPVLLIHLILMMLLILPCVPLYPNPTYPPNCPHAPDHPSPPSPPNSPNHIQPSSQMQC